ncbi:MAG TPA: hypothetical protein VJ866_25135 [Pyrinomonadaceae bacterium]|nr:hypothetical protein [Pyrinomonadaceae bacterium]
MDMSSKLEYLKQHYGFEEWRGRETLQESLLIWKFFPGADDLPGWQPQRVQRVITPDAEKGSVSESAWGRGDGPAAIQSLWQQSEGSEALLRLDTFECASRSEAKEHLLRLLGEFQSPALRRADTVAGDVAFTFSKETVVLFARANLVLLLRNAGRSVQPLAPLATQLDQTLISKPEAEGQRGVVKIREFDAQELSGERITLEVSEQEEPQQWYKFFSPSGELRLEAGRPVYVPKADEGPGKVTMYVVQSRRTDRGTRLTY